MPRTLFAIVPFLFVAAAQAEPAAASGLQVPPGFTVTEFAGDDLAHDCYTLTINPKGQVVVAGRGYIRTLIDDDRDGRADRAIEVADHPKDGAMGLLWEGDTLWAVGDDGLRRFKIGPDGKAVGPSELVRKLKTGGEHDAHAIRRGPDGWLYLLCGNHAGVSAEDAQRPTSPVRDPIAGAVLRFPPDMSYSEVVADGFRNPYDFDFNGDGELVTFDSDNERCVGLPWYEGCRLYHVLPGGHYGWQAPQRGAFWRMPPYFPDVVAPLADVGRGSPTGVACYWHRQFPEKYRGGFFLGDWTFGRIYFASLITAGSTYTAKVERFLEAVGDNGFAPTGLAVHPLTGDLYVSIGGRGTRGAVYRVRYDAGVKEAAGYIVPRLPQRSLDWWDGLKAEILNGVQNEHGPTRRRALEMMVRYLDCFTIEERIKAYLATMGDDNRISHQLAIRILGPEPDPKSIWRKMETSRDRATTALWNLRHGDSIAAQWACDIIGPVYLTADESAEIVRGCQLLLGGLGAKGTLGTLWEGYTARDAITSDKQKMVESAIRRSFPSGHANFDREMARTLAMLADDDPKMLAKMAEKLTDASDPIDDIHYLACLARLTASRTPDVTLLVKNALLDLDRKMTVKGIHRDTNWPLRIAELHAELARRDPTLNDLLVADLDFPRPANAVFTRCPGFDRARAARRFFERAKGVRDFSWTPELVTLMGELPAETARPLLLMLWDRGGFEGAIIPLLARQPLPADRDKFVAGLRMPQQASVCLAALEKLPAAADSTELLALIRVLRSLSDSAKADASLREKIVRRLQKLTGQTIGPDKAAWSGWLTKTHPDLAAKLGGADGVDVPTWQKRFAAIDWPAGNADHGKATFTKASCASCHSSGSAVGPDLRGVAARFGRDDLLTAIIQPSKDIAPRYRSVQIGTTDGKSYLGLIVYEAPDGVMLQTGPGAMVRIAGAQIESRGISDTSLMPAGLMDKLTDSEIADLLAYLKVMK